MDHPAVLQRPRHDLIGRPRPRGDDPVIAAQAVRAGDRDGEPGRAQRQRHAGRERDRRRRDVIVAAVPDPDEHEPGAERRGVGAAGPRGLEASRHRRQRVEHEGVRARAVRGRDPRQVADLVGELLAVGEPRAPRQDLDDLPGAGPVRLIAGIGGERDGPAIGADRRAVQRRGVVVAPRQVRRVDQLDAERLVLGAEVAGRDRGRAQVADRPGGVVDGERGVDLALAGGIDDAGAAGGPAVDHRLPRARAVGAGDARRHPHPPHRAQARRGVGAAQRDLEQLAVLDRRDRLLPRLDVDQVGAIDGQRRTIGRGLAEPVVLQREARGRRVPQAQAAEVERAGADVEVAAAAGQVAVGDREALIGAADRADHVELVAALVLQADPFGLVPVVVDHHPPELHADRGVALGRIECVAALLFGGHGSFLQRV